MDSKTYKYPDTKAFEFVTTALAKRGVDLHELANDAYELQKEFLPDLTVADCYEELLTVLHKRELLNNAMVALELDRLTEAGLIQEPLQSIITHDLGVFGVDEAWPCKLQIFTALLALQILVMLTGSNPALSRNMIPMPTTSILLSMTC